MAKKGGKGSSPRPGRHGMPPYLDGRGCDYSCVFLLAGRPRRRGWQHETKQKLPASGPLTLDTAGQELTGGPGPSP